MSLNCPNSTIFPLIFTTHSSRSNKIKKKKSESVKSLEQKNLLKSRRNKLFSSLRKTSSNQISYRSSKFKNSCGKSLCARKPLQTTPNLSKPSVTVNGKKLSFILKSHLLLLFKREFLPTFKKNLF